MARAEMVRRVGLSALLQAVLVVLAGVPALAVVQAGVPRFQPMAALAATARAVMAALAVMRRAVTPAV